MQVTQMGVDTSLLRPVRRPMRREPSIALPDTLMFSGHRSNRSSIGIGLPALVLSALMALVSTAFSAPVPRDAGKVPVVPAPQVPPPPGVQVLPPPRVVGEPSEEELTAEQIKQKEEAERLLQERTKAEKNTWDMERHLIRLGKTSGDQIELLTRDVIRVLDVNPQLKVSDETRKHLTDSAARFAKAKKTLEDSGITGELPVFGDVRIKDAKQQAAMKDYIQFVAMDGGREIRNLLSPVSAWLRADSKREYWSDKHPLNDDVLKVLMADKGIQDTWRQLQGSVPAMSLANISLTIQLRDWNHHFPNQPFRGRLERDYDKSPFVE